MLNLATCRFYLQEKFVIEEAIENILPANIFDFRKKGAESIFNPR